MYIVLCITMWLR